MSASVAAAAATASASLASAADLAQLASRSSASGGDSSAYSVRAALAATTKLLGDEDTFRTMVSIGLPAPQDYVPPMLSFALFKRLESKVEDPGTFMDAAIEYVEYSRDANDLIELARMSRTNGATHMATQDYLDRMMLAARGADQALQRMVPLLPKS